MGIPGHFGCEALLIAFKQFCQLLNVDGLDGWFSLVVVCREVSTYR